MKTAAKHTRKTLRIAELALLLGTAVFLLTGAWALNTQRDLADRVVRLHVLANSDSEEDQALKLLVRDAVLDRAEALLTQSEDRAEAEALLSGEHGFLLESGDPLLLEFYSKLRGNSLAPRTVVCYDREAFAYAPGNVRVTLDRNIRTGRSALEFFRPERFALRPLDGSTVLEVKYDAFLPDLVRMAVQVPDRRAGACSKYALCRRFD